MTRYLLIANSVQSYPRVSASSYNPDRIAALLKEYGVTEIHRVRRVEYVPSDNLFASSPRQITHDELCFAAPTAEQFAASPKGKAPTGSSTFNPMSALESDLRRMVGTNPGVSLTNWALGAERVFNLCQSVSSYMDVSLEDSGIEVSTREHGDVGDEDPGAEDIKAARTFARKIKETFPNLPVAVDAVDEWVSVTICFDDITEASLGTTPSTSEADQAPTRRMRP